jgi:hypothetical protein
MYIANDSNFRTLYSRIANDQRIFWHFKDYIGTIDSSHINASTTKKKSSLHILEGVVNQPKM